MTEQTDDTIRAELSYRFPDGVTYALHYDIKGVASGAPALDRLYCAALFLVNAMHPTLLSKIKSLGLPMTDEERSRFEVEREEESA